MIDIRGHLHHSHATATFCHGEAHGAEADNGERISQQA